MPTQRVIVGERFRKDLGDLETLAQSIKKIGLLHPIVVTENGLLVSGCRRLQAWKLLGRNEADIPRTTIPHFIPEAEVEENTVRKDFTITEMVEIKRHYQPQIAQEAQKRVTANLPNNTFTNPEIFRIGETRNIIGKIVGVSGRTLEKAEKIVEAAEQNPERFNTLLENVETGKTSISYAYDVVSRAERHENPPPLPKGEYDVIYADPPWNYYYKARGNPEYHYPLMEDEEIYALKIPSAKNSVLFLWATNPKLQEALKVVTSWGFVYKTNMVWVKDKFGTGFYVRGQHELLLIATKGTIPTPVNDTRPSSIIEAPRREHSRKPDQVYEIIESMYPNRNYVELFARNERQGWTSWGDEL